MCSFVTPDTSVLFLFHSYKMEDRLRSKDIDVKVVNCRGDALQKEYKYACEDAADAGKHEREYDCVYKKGYGLQNGGIVAKSFCDGKNIQSYAFDGEKFVVTKDENKTFQCECPNKENIVYKLSEWTLDEPSTAFKFTEWEPPSQEKSS